MFQSPELNLAEEVYDLLLTDKDCSPIYSPYIWKKFRRNSENRKIRCNACNIIDSPYVEGQQSCPYCSGLGYVYDEKLFPGYLYKQGVTRDFGNLWMKEPVGTTDVSRYLLFTDKHTSIGLEDRILIPELNLEGKIAIPLDIVETCKCTYSRYFKASQNKTDFNVALLGG